MRRTTRYYSRSILTGTTPLICPPCPIPLAWGLIAHSILMGCEASMIRWARKITLPLAKPPHTGSLMKRRISLPFFQLASLRLGTLSFKAHIFTEAAKHLNTTYPNPKGAPKSQSSCKTKWTAVSFIIKHLFITAAHIFTA